MAKAKKETPAPKEEGASGGKGNKAVLLVGLIGILLGGSGLGAYALFLAPKGAKDTADAELGEKKEGDEKETDGHGEAKDDGHGKPKDDGHGKPKDDGHGKPKDDGHGKPKDDGHGKPKDDGHGKPKDDGHGEAKDDGHGGEPGETKTDEDGTSEIIVELKPNFVVNLTETYATRMLRTEIGLKVSAESVKNQVETTQKIPIRDFIINELSKARIEEIDNEEGKNRLKRILRRGINSLLKGGQVSDVYFAEFVIK